MRGNGNTVLADITKTSSKVNLQSDGDTIKYDIDQNGTDGVGGINTIVARVTKTGDAQANITLAQTGKGNNIILGNLGTAFDSAFADNYNYDAGSAGLTLLGGADVSITQTADNANYTASNTIPDGGSLTIVQN